MRLTTDDKAAFTRDGLLIRRGLVPPDLVGAATGLIADWYRAGLDTSLINLYTQRTFAPELGDHPALLALYHQSGVADLAHELLGDTEPVTTAQIQIRLPGADLGANQPSKPMHVDGVSCPHLDPTELRTFTLLAGIVLSHVTDPDGGALRYVPGGHHTMADWFRTEWSLGITDQVPPQLDAEHGTPFLGEPGDVILMHHLVPHAAGHNHTPGPRVMAYFRISHTTHASDRLAALRDPWHDYPGLRSLARQG